MSSSRRGLRCNVQLIVAGEWEICPLVIKGAGRTSGGSSRRNCGRRNRRTGCGGRLSLLFLGCNRPPCPCDLCWRNWPHHTGQRGAGAPGQVVLITMHAIKKGGLVAQEFDEYVWSQRLLVWVNGIGYSLPARESANLVIARVHTLRVLDLRTTLRVPRTPHLSAPLRKREFPEIGEPRETHYIDARWACAASHAALPKPSRDADVTSRVFSR